jgi:AAA+ superfamily predicted ATPase
MTESKPNELLSLYIEFFQARRVSLGGDSWNTPETVAAGAEKASSILKQIDIELKNQSKIVKRVLGNASRMEIHLFMAVVYSKLTGIYSSHFELPSGRDIFGLLVETKYVPKLIPLLSPDCHLVSQRCIFSPDIDVEASVLSAHWNVSDTSIMSLCGIGSISAHSPGEKTEQDTLNCGAYELRENPRFTLDDIVLSENARASVQSAITLYRNSDRLYSDFGLGDSIKYGRGCTILLYGPPGTGKTMLAEGIAGSLGRPLVAADYPGILSKWYGESQKNISLLFRAAESKGAVLLIDEADAICSERIAECSTAVGKSMNQELLILCNELEKFSGVAILTTNLAAVLDSALDRRLMLKLELKVPNAKERTQLWSKHIGSKLPLAADVDVSDLARKFEISGGLIKNAVVSATARALARDNANPQVCMDDFIQAALSQKAGYRETVSNVRIGLRQLT